MTTPTNSNLTRTLRLLYGSDDGANRNLEIIDTQWARLLAGEIALPIPGDGGSGDFTNITVGSLIAADIQCNSIVVDDTATFQGPAIFHGPGLSVDNDITVDGVLDTKYVLIDSINFKPGASFNTPNGPVIPSASIVNLEWTKLINVPPGLASGSATPIGPSSGDLTGPYPGPSLVPSGVSAGSYGDATNVPRIVVDAKGRITAVSLVPLSASGPPVGAASGDLTGNYPGPTINTGKVTTAKLAPGAVAGQLVILKDPNYVEFGRNSTAPFTLATLPALTAGQLIRLTIVGTLSVTGGVFNIQIKSPTGWTTPTTLFFYGQPPGGTFHCELLLWQNGGGNSYSFSSLTHQFTASTPPATAMNANGIQSATSYQAATGPVTVYGTFSVSDPNNVLIRLLALAEQL